MKASDYPNYIPLLDEFEAEQRKAAQSIRRGNSDPITTLRMWPLRKLKPLYWRLCRELSSSHPEAAERTSCEKLIREIFRHCTRLQIFTSIWIGPFCFDLFIPALCGHPHARGYRGPNRLRGVVIEIDGPIHNTELKGKKDLLRMEFLLNRVGIGSTSINNSDLRNTEWVVKFIKGLAKEKRQDQRSRERMWKRIMIITFLAHRDRTMKLLAEES